MSSSRSRNRNRRQWRRDSTGRLQRDDNSPYDARDRSRSRHRNENESSSSSNNSASRSRRRPASNRSRRSRSHHIQNQAEQASSSSANHQNNTRIDLTVDSPPPVELLSDSGNPNRNNNAERSRLRTLNNSRNRSRRQRTNGRRHGDALFRSMVCNAGRTYRVGNSANHNVPEITISTNRTVQIHLDLDDHNHNRHRHAADNEGEDEELDFFDDEEPEIFSPAAGPPRRLLTEIEHDSDDENEEEDAAVLEALADRQDERDMEDDSDVEILNVIEGFPRVQHIRRLNDHQIQMLHIVMSEMARDNHFGNMEAFISESEYGMSSAERRLPVRTLTLQDIQAQSCTICLNQFAVSDKVTTLPCFHQFHSDCVNSWFQTKLNCPTCRHSIRSIEMNLEQQEEVL